MCDSELELYSSFKRSRLQNIDLGKISDYLFNTNLCEITEKYVDGYVPVDGVTTTLKGDSILLLSELFNMSVDKIVNALNMNLSIVQALYLDKENTPKVVLDTIDSGGGFSFSVKNELMYFNSNTHFITYLCRLRKLNPKTYLTKFRYFFAMGCDLQEARATIYEYIINKSGRWLRLDNTMFGGTVWLTTEDAISVSGRGRTTIIDAITKYTEEFDNYTSSLRRKEDYTEPFKYIHLGFSEYFNRFSMVRNIPFEGVLYSTDKDLCDKLDINYSWFKRDMVKFGDVETCIISTIKRRGKKNNGN